MLVREGFLTKVVREAPLPPAIFGIIGNPEAVRLIVLSEMVALIAVELLA